MIINAEFKEENRVLNADFGVLSRGALGESGIIVEQTYSPDSSNAQSGKAVAEAIAQATGDIETALDNIIAIQEELIGGDSI